MNRKSFLQRLGLGIAALWASCFGAKASLPTEDVSGEGLTLYERAGKELQALATALNKDQLWCSRFPSLATSSWKPFRTPGVLGCSADGSNGFLWIELTGPVAEIERLAQAFKNKPEAVLPVRDNEWPTSWSWSKKDLDTFRIRTPILSIMDGERRCLRFVRSTTTDVIEALKPFDNWQEVYAETRQSYVGAVAKQRMAIVGLLLDTHS